MIFLHVVVAAVCSGRAVNPEGNFTCPYQYDGDTCPSMPTSTRTTCSNQALRCLNCSFETVELVEGTEFVFSKEPWQSTPTTGGTFCSSRALPGVYGPGRREQNALVSTRYTIQDFEPGESNGNSHIQAEADETMLFSLQGPLMVLPALVGGFDFAYPEDEHGAPGWYLDALEGGKELIENGIKTSRLAESILSEFTNFDDTFMAENEDQLNSLIRSLEKFEENRDPAVRWYGRPREIREKDIRTFGRNTAVIVRHFWHWRRCPVAMENRVAEAHLRRLDIHPVTLSPGRDWEEEKERRMLSRSRSPQRRQAQRRRPTGQDGDGDTVSMTQKRKSTGSREEGQDEQRRRRTRAWRGRVATELAGLRTPRARAEARRHLFFQLCRVHGPDIVPFAEGLLESVWDLADAEPVGRQTVDSSATDWAVRVANEVGTMWVDSRGSGSASAGASASSGSGGPRADDLVPVRRTATLDPPESTPYGIFHAAWVWPNGSWSTCTG